MRSNVLFLVAAAISMVIHSDCDKGIFKSQSKPNADFSFDESPAKIGEEIHFKNHSQNASSYLWSFGDGNTSVDENPTHSYSKVGTFDVALTATGEGGKSSKSKAITIGYPTPVANFDVDRSSALIGEIILFTNKSLYASSYLWDFGDSTTSTDANPKHAYSNSGEYSITLTAKGDEGIASMSKSITIYFPPPTASFSIEKTSARPGETISFLNKSKNSSSYEWDFGDGTISNETNPSHQYATYGSYTVVLKAINEGGIGRYSRTIFIKEFTVMTYNIAIAGGAIPEVVEIARKDGHPAHLLSNRISGICSVIREANPDILGLQETFLWDSYDPPFYKAIADSLNMNYYYYPERDKVEWNGICIYSKYPLVPTDFLLHQPCVPSRTWNGTFMVKAKVDITNKATIDIFVCHLMVQVPGAQDCEIETLGSYLKSNYNPNTILMGDMNFTAPYSYGYDEILRGANLYYLNSLGLSQTQYIDQIWASKELYDISKIYDSANIDNFFSPSSRGLLDHISDHKPVIAHFGFK